MVLSVSPPSYPRAVTSCLDQIASELDQDPNLLRIKKLLFYVCTETWDTGPQRLERLSLRVLLQHLLEISPTFEDFQQKINHSAATLNKSAEYTILANAVISRFPVVYAELHQGTLVTASQELYWTVVQQLQAVAPRPAAQTRIKKLLLLTCRGTWENGADKLAALSLLELVQELHQIAPTAESLKTTLNQVAQAVSKPTEYSQVADTISLVFQTLYSESAYCGSAPETVAEAMGEKMTKTVTKIANRLHSVPGSVPVIPALAATDCLTEPGVAASDATASDMVSLPCLTSEQPTQTMLRAVRTPKARPASAPPILNLSPVAQPRKIIDLFDLRLEIMQDSNPYRVKVLLFSLLHEAFRSNADHEALLRTHELDDLLHILFLSYRQYAELVNSLRQTAIALGKEDYMQAAEALLRAVQAYYITDYITVEPIGESLPQVALTDITNIKAANHEITLPD